MTQIDIIRQMLVGDREPDEIINDTVNGEQVPYLRRWFVKKDEDGGRVYLHNFMRSDFERATHDHPWDSTSILLWGEYKEHLADGTVAYRKSGDIVTRKAEDSHRIEFTLSLRGRCSSPARRSVSGVSTAPKAGCITRSSTSRRAADDSIQ